MYGLLRSALCLSIMLLWTSPAAGNETTPALKLRVAYKFGVITFQDELHFTYADLEWFHSCLCQGRSRTWSVPLAAVHERTLKIASTTNDCVVHNSADLSRTKTYQCTLVVEYLNTNPNLICTERALDAGLCEDRSNSQPEAQCLSLTLGKGNICGGECMDFLWDPLQRVRSVNTTNSHLHLGSCRSVKSKTTWTSISTSPDDKNNTTADVGGGNTAISNDGVIAGIATGVVVLLIITIVIVVVLWRWRKHKLLTLNAVPSILSTADSPLAVQQRGSSLHSEYEITMSGSSQAKITENKDDDGYMLMNIKSKNKPFPNASHIKANSHTKERHILTQDKDYCTMSYEGLRRDFDGTDDLNYQNTAENKRTHSEETSGGKPAVVSVERKPNGPNHNDQSMDAVYAVVCKNSKPILSIFVLAMTNPACEPSSENSVGSSLEETTPSAHGNDHQSETASGDVYAKVCKEMRPNITMVKPGRAPTHTMLSNSNASSSLGKSQNFDESVELSDSTSDVIYSNVC